jgi:hypothetical protein
MTFSTKRIWLRRCCRHETITAADRRNFQVQRRMLRMATLIQKLQVRLMCSDNIYEDVVLMVFAKVRTQSALTRVDSFHEYLRTAFEVGA